MGRIGKRFLLLALCGAIGSSLAFGQGFTASVLGTVTDTTGASIPAAIVTTTNISTGVKSTVTANADGGFTVPQLQPGDYRITVEAMGFKRAVQEPVTLTVDQRQVINFKLELGVVSETVNVSAETDQVQAETATVGATVGQTQASELPLNGRNFLQLPLLLPGSAPVVKGSNLSAQGGSIEVHGLPENWNYFWVDGLDNESMSVGQYIVNVPPFTIEEFRIMSPTYDAQFGRTPGAQINVITRSGTNNYHGDVYLFIRNDVFDAKNFFDPPGTIPAYRRGQYGADLGGKIIKDKLFYYGAFEGQRFAQAESAKNIVPTPQETVGNFSALGSVIKDPTTNLPFPGNVIPANRLNSTGLQYAAFFPAPNNGPNSLLVNPTGWDHDDVAVAKFDYQMSSKNRVSFTYVFEDHSYHQPIASFSNTTNIPGFGIDDTGAHDITTGVTDTYIFSPNLIGEFRVGWDRFEFQYHAQDRFQDWCATLNIQGCDEGKINWFPPVVSLNGVYSSVGGGNDQYGPFDATSFHPTMTWVKGKHTVKWGYEFYHFFTTFSLGLGPRGSFTFNGVWTGNPLADLLLGLPYQASKTVIADQPNDERQFVVMGQTAGFVQDDYRITSHLTLNLGLRYEYSFPGYDQRDHLANLNLTNGVANAIPMIEGVNGVGQKLYNADPNQWAPRFGFAYSPTPEWAIRGGVGIFYQMINQNNVLSLHNNPPFSNPYTVVGNGSTITINNALVTGLVANVPAYTAFSLNMKAGMVEQFSLGVQRQLPRGIILDVGYVGNRGRDIDNSVAVNTPIPGPGAVQARRPDPSIAGINLFGPWTSSEYDGLETRLEKRLSNGMQFVAAYTWSRAFDNAGTPQNPRDLQGQWGPSTYDIPSHFSLSYVYQLPVGKGRAFLSGLNRVGDAILGGWQLNGIYQYHSGLTFTPILPIDNTNTQVNNDRPNLVGNPYQSTASCQTGTPNCWVNAAAFATPAQYTFGNAGKGEVRGPNFSQLDFAMAKNFAVGEKRRIEFRAEAFNIFNRVNFDNPGATLSSSFGIITTAEPSRQMQFGARFIF